MFKSMWFPWNWNWSSEKKEEEKKDEDTEDENLITIYIHPSFMEREGDTNDPGETWGKPKFYPMDSSTFESLFVPAWERLNYWCGLYGAKLEVLLPWNVYSSSMTDDPVKLCEKYGEYGVSIFNIKTKDLLDPKCSYGQIILEGMSKSRSKHFETRILPTVGYRQKHFGMLFGNHGDGNRIMSTGKGEFRIWWGKMAKGVRETHFCARLMWHEICHGFGCEHQKDINEADTALGHLLDANPERILRIHADKLEENGLKVGKSVDIVT